MLTGTSKFQREVHSRGAKEWIKTGVGQLLPISPLITSLSKLFLLQKMNEISKNAWVKYLELKQSLDSNVETPAL